MELIYSWFQGTFDNNCQCQFEKEVQKREGTEPVHDWVWTKFLQQPLQSLVTMFSLQDKVFVLLDKCTGNGYTSS